MRSSRRILVGISLFGIAITVLVVLQQQGDDAAADTAASKRLSVGTSRNAQQVAPGTEPAASDPGVETTGDESLTRCTQTLKLALDYATRERDAANSAAGPQWSEAKWNAEVPRLQRGLSGSRDPEDFLVAMLLDQPERRAAKDASAQSKLLELGERAASAGSKVLAWHALRACDDAKQSCPISHLEQRLLEVDRQNAEAWALVATRKYERGDIAGALTAMQGAAHAPTSTWYWTETIALIERALAAETDMPYAQRMTGAIGTDAAAGLPSQSNLLKMCKAQSVASREWGEACLALGELRTQRNETLMAQSIGYSLREQALAALGDRERAVETAAERALVDAERSTWTREPGRSMTRLQSALLETDAGAYLAAIQQYGEREGIRMFLRQQVPPLLERAGLLGKQGARECAAHFFAAPRPASAGQQARVADELHLTFRGLDAQGESGWSRAFRVPADGKIQVPLNPRPGQPQREVVVAGKTTEQIQREVATILAGYYQSPRVNVVLLARLSDEELRAEFANAQKEAAEGLSQAR